MVLLNKAALSSFDFNAPMSLLFFQCVVCVVLVRVSATLGFIRVERMNMAIVRLWFPVNLIFVGMIFTSFFALKALGVPMATVLKNLTNLFTIGGDFFLYKKVSLMPCFIHICFGHDPFLPPPLPVGPSEFLACWWSFCYN